MEVTVVVAYPEQAGNKMNNFVLVNSMQQRQHNPEGMRISPEKQDHQWQLVASV